MLPSSAGSEALIFYMPRCLPFLFFFLFADEEPAMRAEFLPVFEEREIFHSFLSSWSVVAVTRSLGLRRLCFRIDVACTPFLLRCLS